MYRYAAVLTLLIVIGFWILEGASVLSSVFSHLRVPEKIQLIAPSVPEMKPARQKEVQEFLNGNTLSSDAKKASILILKVAVIEW